MRGSHLLRVLPLAACVAASIGLPSARARAEEEVPALGRVLEARSAAVVPLRLILAIQASMPGKGGTTREQPMTAMAAVVDPSGLMVSSALFAGGGIGEFVKRAMSRRFQGLDVHVSATHHKAVLGADQTEAEAVLVARDDDLGLAWVQIVDPPAGLPVVDLGTGSTPRIGEDLVVVTRLSRSFDHAPEARACHVVRRVERPRLLWGVGGDLETGFPPALGIPAFDVEGTPVGILVAQMADSEEGLSTLMRRGKMAPSGDAGEFLLPLEEVRRSMEAAKKRVPEALAKAREAKAKEEKEKAAEAAMSGDKPAGGDAPSMGEPPAPGTTPPPAGMGSEPAPTPPGMG